MPALFTSRAIGPSSVSTRSTSFVTSRALVTSATIAIAFTPAFFKSTSDSESLAESRPQIATSAPRLASLSAIALPIPREPPVTRAIFRASGFSVRLATDVFVSLMLSIGIVLFQASFFVTDSSYSQGTRVAKAVLPGCAALRRQRRRNGNLGHHFRSAQVRQKQFRQTVKRYS